MSPLFAVGLLLVSSSAQAQIIQGNLVRVIQEEHTVGLIWVGLPPDPCRSTER